MCMGLMLRVLIAVYAVCLLAALPAGAATPAVDDCLRTVDGIDLQTATVTDMQAAMDAGTLSASTWSTPTSPGSPRTTPS